MSTDRIYTEHAPNPKDQEVKIRDQVCGVYSIYLLDKAMHQEMLSKRNVPERHRKQRNDRKTNGTIHGSRISDAITDDSRPRKQREINKRKKTHFATGSQTCDKFNDTPRITPSFDSLIRAS